MRDSLQPPPQPYLCQGTSEEITEARSIAGKMNLTHFAINYTQFMVDWENTQWNTTELPVAGVGDVVGISRALLRKYSSLDSI